MMSRSIPIYSRRLDLVFIFGMLLLAAIFTLTSWRESVFRLPVTVTFVFLVPGLSITNNLFYRLALPFHERLAYSIGLSVAIMALGGLVLHGFRLGFQAPAWMLLLSTVTVINLALTILRLPGKFIHEAYIVPSVSIYELILYGMTALLICFAVLFAVIGDRFPTTRVTELWVDPQTETATHLNIGVSNHELESLSYRVEVVINRTTVYTETIEHLPNNDTWEASVTLPPPAPFGDLVKVLLYRQDDPTTIYRQVYVRR